MKNLVPALGLSLSLAALPLLAKADAEATTFVSSSSVEEVQQQFAKLPTDKIWWRINGEDMLWNNKNLHRFSPTVNVYRDGPVRELEYALNPAAADFPVKTPSGNMRFVDFLDSDHSTSQGVVILHQGKIVFEHYARMQPYEKPIYWSVTKTTVAAVIAILEARGEIDIDRPIDHYVPELAHSTYKGIPIRHVLDMATGVDCSEEYDDKNACYYKFMQTTGLVYWDKNSPNNPYDYMQNLQAPHFAKSGTSYEYGSINTNLLGWLVESVTGLPFQDAFSQEIWQHIGAEGDASFLAPRNGYAEVGGGLLARLRDVARFGLLYTPSYTVVSDQPLIPAAHIEHLKNGGNPKSWENPRWPWEPASDVKYNVYQWDQIYDNNDIYKGGWAGQGLLVNPDKDLVVVYTGYFKDAKGSEMSVQPIIRALLKQLYPDKT